MEFAVNLIDPENNCCPWELVELQYSTVVLSMPCAPLEDSKVLWDHTKPKV